MRYSLGRDRRLRKPSDFRYVRRQGRSWASYLLVLQACSNGLNQSRFGISAGRRVGKAVVRNRVKRRLRELLRTTPLKEGLDIVVIARVPSSQATFQDLEIGLTRLMSEANVVVDPESTEERRS